MKTPVCPQNRKYGSVYGSSKYTLVPLIDIRVSLRFERSVFSAGSLFGCITEFLHNLVSTRKNLTLSVDKNTVHILSDSLDKRMWYGEGVLEHSDAN